ncbi:hypothetical protein LMG31884_30880 [Xanthomonas hydrangeae]|nr:hypothetical protein LMG31884_30880 [Xanthomonas hydrangeae]CAD7719730.1 hypothetical protein LMG31884_30880 [Xanthomonas hydrangeae]CAD7737030.1 hypothetical protein LMG31887_30780 [Xanthomonas hydrangeae]CAD7737033.1 hypothetical protein LMG31887_30780 [Xanthomonas hydrangeae]
MPCLPCLQPCTPTLSTGPCPPTVAGPYAAWMPRKSLQGRTCGVSCDGGRARAPQPIHRSAALPSGVSRDGGSARAPQPIHRSAALPCGVSRDGGQARAPQPIHRSAALPCGVSRDGGQARASQPIHRSAALPCGVSRDAGRARASQPSRQSSALHPTHTRSITYQNGCELQRRRRPPGGGNSSFVSRSQTLASSLITLEKSSAPLPAWLFIAYRLRASSPSGIDTPACTADSVTSPRSLSIRSLPKPPL